MRIVMSVNSKLGLNDEASVDEEDDLNDSHDGDVLEESQRSREHELNS